MSSAAIADLSQPIPHYKATRSMDTAKLYVSAVILPDSTVLETGGAASAQDNGSTPVFSTEIFDPKKNTWSKAATHQVPRVYHSSALLLPDGRVATFGGNPSGSWEMRVEIYTPATSRPVRRVRRSTPARPRSATATTTRSAPPQASPLKSAVLVRPASVTHSSDSNQRLVNLPFTRTAGGLTFSVTGEPNLAPPGWYMLFVVDGDGVPSVAKWVHLA